MGLKQRNMTAALSVHTAERGLLISVQKRERADLSEFTVTKTQNSKLGNSGSSISCVDGTDELHSLLKT